MTPEEEKMMMQYMMAQMMREQEPADLGGHMTAPMGPQGGGPQNSGMRTSPQQQGGGGNQQIYDALANRGGEAVVSPNATGAMMSEPFGNAAVSYPTSAGSMAASTPAAEMAAGGSNLATAGGVDAANMALIGEGGESALGSASTWVAPAAAMAALIRGGKELGIGASDQLDEYKRFFKGAGKEVGRAADKLKFWEWF